MSVLDLSWAPDELGRLALCSLPGELGGTLQADLATLREQGVTHLLCLVQPRELAELGETPQQRAAAVRAAGLDYRHVAVEDFEPPTLDQVQGALAFVEEAWRQGGAVAVHCWAGLGRSGTIAACALVRFQAMEPRQAIAAVRAFRPGAVQTEEQEDLVESWWRELGAPLHDLS